MLDGDARLAGNPDHLQVLGLYVVILLEGHVGCPPWDWWLVTVVLRVAMR
jgi:hypothetical protein